MSRYRRYGKKRIGGKIIITILVLLLIVLCVIGFIAVKNRFFPVIDRALNLPPLEKTDTITTTVADSSVQVKLEPMVKVKRIIDSIPVEIVNNQVFINVKINGIGPVRCLYDTGCTSGFHGNIGWYLVLNSQTKLKNLGNSTAVVAGGENLDIITCILDSIVVGNFTIKDIDANFSTSMNNVDKDECLLGYNTIKQFGDSHLDMERGVIYIFE